MQAGVRGVFSMGCAAAGKLRTTATTTPRANDGNETILHA
jgi:hypothetical protein